MNRHKNITHFAEVVQTVFKFHFIKPQYLRSLENKRDPNSYKSKLHLLLSIKKYEEVINEKGLMKVQSVTVCKLLVSELLSNRSVSNTFLFQFGRGST